MNSLLHKKIIITDMTLLDYGKKGRVVGEIIAGVHKGDIMVVLGNNSYSERFRRNQVKECKQK
jgi:hypothetical protein